MPNLQRRIASALFPFTLCMAFVNCGGNSASDGTGSEVAVTAIGGSSTASEGAVALSAPSSNNNKDATFLAWLEKTLSPMPSAWAVPSCSWSSLISSCTNNSETISFNSCSLALDPSIRISGSETLTWSTGCCTATPLSAASPCSFTRLTVNSSGAADPLIRSVGANSATLNTQDSSGYAQTKTGGFTIACQGTGGTNTCDAQRQITINGAHYTGQSGRTQWDHTVSTDVPVIVQGDGGTRKVLSGTVRIQHNLAQMTSITTIGSTLTYTAGCCLPTGGSVTTSFSGGKLDGKSEIMTFGPTCGAAMLTDTKQQQTGLTLHHCL